ncbi:MAG: flagellar protein FlaG [Candidatus Eremiobacteraeota bacterium]|nr:flagellar protein FlaG [Candidatus Eremiobacteraeota bacterium]
MDVQSLAQSVVQTPPSTPVPPNSVGAAPPATDVQSNVLKGAAAGSGTTDDTTLQKTIQKLFAPSVANVDVSFRVVHDPNEIVTVFTNRDTGQEIAQFPPEIMVQLAEFFQKIAGAVMDRKV